MIAPASARPTSRSAPPVSARVSWFSIAVTSAFSVLATACGLASFWPIYRSADFVTMVLITVVVGTAIAVAGAVFRLSSAAVAASTVAAYLLLGVPLAVPSETFAGVLGTWRGYLDLVAGAALGWKQLVTIAVPVGSYQALLVLAFLLGLLAAVTSTTIAVRTRRGEWALLIPIVVFATGIALGPETGAPQLPAAIALVVILLTWAAWFRAGRRSATIRAMTAHAAQGNASTPRRGGNGARAALAAAIVITVAAGAGGIAAVFVPADATRQVARSALEKPFDPRAYPSPLSGFRNYLEPANAAAPMLKVSGLNGVRRIRIATLDTYDGVVYAVGSSGADAASDMFSRVPGALSATATGRQRQLSVTVQGYHGVWLPETGALRQIRFSGGRAAKLQDSVYTNSSTGTSAVLGGLATGDRYSMKASVDAGRTIAQLADLTPGTAVLSRLETVPDGVDAAVHTAALKAHGPGGTLAAALKALVDRGYVSHGIGPDDAVSASGHGADRISALLTDVPMLGDQEQYAVAAALVARRIGFPARVVVGFVVPGESAASGTVTLTGSDISAWIQVQTAEYGWVSVDPNPAVRPIPQEQPKDPRQISRPQSAVQPPAQEDRHDSAAPPQSQVSKTPDKSENALVAAFWLIARIAGWVLLGVAIVLAPFVAIIAAKWRRRKHRRSAPSALARITGGWREFCDAAVDNGVVPPPSATRSEVAHAVGGARPLALASVADRAVFAPSEVSDHDADRVWNAVDELRRTLGERKTRWQRIRAKVSLVSLGGYRIKRRGR